MITDVQSQPGLCTYVFNTVGIQCMQVHVDNIVVDLLECLKMSNMYHLHIPSGNLVADIMCRATKADCAILNSGTLRSDVVHDTGVFKMRVSVLCTFCL